MGSVDHRHRLTPRHRGPDLAEVLFPQTDRVDHGVHRRRLPGRVVPVLVAVRTYSFADLGLRRQPDRRRARLRHLFSMPSARYGQAIARFLPAPAASFAGFGAGAGHDRSWLSGTRLYAVSGSAADGGVLRAGSDIRIAHQDFSVSLVGEPRRSEKRAAGPGVL